MLDHLIDNTLQTDVVVEFALCDQVKQTPNVSGERLRPRVTQYRIRVGEIHCETILERKHVSHDSAHGRAKRISRSEESHVVDFERTKRALIQRDDAHRRAHDRVGLGGDRVGELDPPLEAVFALETFTNRLFCFLRH